VKELLKVVSNLQEFPKGKGILTNGLQRESRPDLESGKKRNRNAAQMLQEKEKAFSSSLEEFCCGGLGPVRKLSGHGKRLLVPAPEGSSSLRGKSSRTPKARIYILKKNRTRPRRGGKRQLCPMGGSEGKKGR